VTEFSALQSLLELQVQSIHLENDIVVGEHVQTAIILRDFEEFPQGFAKSLAQQNAICPRVGYDQNVTGRSVKNFEKGCSNSESAIQNSLLREGGNG